MKEDAALLPSAKTFVEEMDNLIQLFRKFPNSVPLTIYQNQEIKLQCGDYFLKQERE
jgi:hypothetical protein